MTDRPDRVEEARRALLTLVPSTDLFSAAEHRASSERSAEVLPLEPAHAHRWRWVAAAAVLALVVGTLVAINRASGSSGVDAGLADDGPPAAIATGSADEFTTYGETCTFAVTGDSLATTPVDWEDTRGRGLNAPVIKGPIGDGQTFLITSGEPAVSSQSMEETELQLADGRSAMLLISDDLAYVYVGGSELSTYCNGGSISVEVSGGSRDANREQAIGLAKRVVQAGLPLDLLRLRTTEWRVSAIYPEPTGMLEPWESLPVDGITIAFGDGTVSWGDGCNELTARAEWELDGRAQLHLRLVDPSSTDRACPAGIQSSEALQRLMRAHEILLYLGGLDNSLHGNGVRLDFVAVDP